MELGKCDLGKLDGDKHGNKETVQHVDKQEKREILQEQKKQRKQVTGNGGKKRKGT